jgi:hypothetical protein
MAARRRHSGGKHMREAQRHLPEIARLGVGDMDMVAAGDCSVRVREETLAR